MANAENINKVIEWIKADAGKHYRMQAFCVHLDDNGDVKDDSPKEYIDCKTAYCIAGCANLIRLSEVGAEPLKITGASFLHQFAKTKLAGE